MDRRCAAVESDRRQTRKPYFNLGGRFKGHPKGEEKKPESICEAALRPNGVIF